MKNYVVYLTYYKGNKLPKWYVGSTSLKKINEGYNGSVSSKELTCIYRTEQKHNKHLFKTRILSYHISREEAYVEELRVQKLHKVATNERYINKGYAGGFIGGDNSENIDYQNEEYKDKISTSIKKRYDIKLGELKVFRVSCHCCNDILEVSEREKQFPKKEKYFCNRSCANSGRKLSTEGRKKVSESSKNQKNRKVPSSKGSIYIHFKKETHRLVRPFFLY